MWNAVRARQSHTKPGILSWTCPSAFVPPKQQPPVADGVTHGLRPRPICWQRTCCLHLCLSNRNVWVCQTHTMRCWEATVHKTLSNFKVFYILKTCSFHSHCLLPQETDWYHQKNKYLHVFVHTKLHGHAAHIVGVGNACAKCPPSFGLKSFIALICTELKSKAPSEEEGHFNRCQELSARCTPFPLTSFHRWGLLCCRLSPNSLFSSIHVWHVQNSSPEQSLASARERGLSGSRAPVLLYHKMLCSGSCRAVFSRTIHGAQSHVGQRRVRAYNPRHVVIPTVFADQFRQPALGSHSYMPVSSWVFFTVQCRDPK